jgi:hypothetical protein
MQHQPMQHVWGYARSHWMPPLGDYLLRIAPPAAMTAANKTTMIKCTNFAGHFDPGWLKKLVNVKF